MKPVKATFQLFNDRAQTLVYIMNEYEEGMAKIISTDERDISTVEAVGRPEELVVKAFHAGMVHMEELFNKKFEHEKA